MHTLIYTRGFKQSWSLEPSCSLKHQLCLNTCVTNIKAYSTTLVTNIMKKKKTNQIKYYKKALCIILGK